MSQITIFIEYNKIPNFISGLVSELQHYGAFVIYWCSFKKSLGKTILCRNSTDLHFYLAKFLEWQPCLFLNGSGQYAGPYSWLLYK